MVYVGKPKGFDKESVFLPLFIRSIDQDRLVRKVSRISKEKILEVEEALKLVLGLTQIDGPVFLTVPKEVKAGTKIR